MLYVQPNLLNWLNLSNRIYQLLSTQYILLSTSVLLCISLFNYFDCFGKENTLSLRSSSGLGTNATLLKTEAIIMVLDSVAFRIFIRHKTC